MSSVKVVYLPAPKCVNCVGKPVVQLKEILPRKGSVRVRCSQQKEAGAAPSVAEVQGSQKQQWNERQGLSGGAVEKATQGTMHETHEHNHGRKRYTCAQSKLTAGQINDER